MQCKSLWIKASAKCINVNAITSALKRTQLWTAKTHLGRYWTKDLRRAPPRLDSHGRWTSERDIGPSCSIIYGELWMRSTSPVNLTRVWWSAGYDYIWHAYHQQQLFVFTTWNRIFVTLDHKTSHKGQFFKIEIYTSSESWINKLSIDVLNNIWLRCNNLKIWILRV